MRFQIDPTPGETRRAFAALARASMPPSRRSAVMIVMYGIVALAAFVLTPSTRPQTIIIGVGAVMLTEALLRWESNRRIRSLRGNDPHELETHFVELTPEGVRTWCEHVDMRYPWREYVRFTEDSEFFLLLRAAGNGTAIPKRVVDVDGEAWIRAQLAERLPRSAA